MATIRDKMGHSTPKHRLDMDLRKPAPALNAGSGGYRYLSCLLDG
jgi:hypothetical protein